MNRVFRLTAVASVVLAAACATTPASNQYLDSAREALRTATADPHVATNAASQLQRAREALQSAETAWAKGDAADTQSLAYVARQRALAATEIGQRAAAEQQLQQMSLERERIRADARTREALLAEHKTKIAQAQAQAAQAQAQSAQQQAQSAQQQALSAQQQADAAREREQAQARLMAAERERMTKMQSDLESLSAKATARGLVVTMSDVLFDTGRAELKSGGVRSLERMASVMKSYPERRVLVEGFTDSQGSEGYNMDLAQRRADAVRRELERFGLPADRIETRAYGQSFPIASNGTPAGRQQNRRVELLISDPKGQFAAR